VLNVVLPPLRDRRRRHPAPDRALPRAASADAREAARSECAAQLLAYAWPGNVRELENEVERLVVLAGDQPMIGVELLSPRIRQWAPADDAAHESRRARYRRLSKALERRMIGAAMRRHSGNKTRAAEDLKVSRRNLIRLVQKYQLE